MLLGLLVLARLVTTLTVRWPPLGLWSRRVVLVVGLVVAAAGAALLTAGISGGVGPWRIGTRMVAPSLDLPTLGAAVACSAVGVGLTAWALGSRCGRHHPAATPGFAHGDDDSKLSDDGAVNSGKETHAHDQHGGQAGHLPTTQEIVRLVGKVGIDVVDISNPAAPRYVSTIPCHTDTFTGEGSQVVTLDTTSFKGDLLVYNNEICPGAEQGIGGVTLVDVTNPLRPKKLVEGFGDFTVKGQSQRHANEIHSAFAWQAGEKAYVVLVDDEEATDIDILDITNPSRPKLISETDLTEETAQPLGAVHGGAVFLHAWWSSRSGAGRSCCCPTGTGRRLRKTQRDGSREPAVHRGHGLRGPRSGLVRCPGRAILSGSPARRCRPAVVPGRLQSSSVACATSR